MTISVLMPTLALSPTIYSAVGSVLSSLEATVGGELLLSADGDEAYQRVADACLPGEVRVLQGSGQGAAAARNLGLFEARNPIILFTDDDCLVPLAWVAQMAEGVEKWGAVGGPVRVPKRGPITSFLDHHRPFDAPPLNSTSVRYLVTANAAVRRDAIPSGGFRNDLFNNACEDAELGYTLRDSGIVLGWCGDSPAVEHILNERIGEIIDRWFRYGTANAKISWYLGRWEESVPDADLWLRDLIEGTWADYRRYREIKDPSSRTNFALLGIVLTASFLMGYLSAVNDLCGSRFIEVDRATLSVGFCRVLDCNVTKAVTDVSSPMRVDPQHQDLNDSHIEELTTAIARACILKSPSRTASEFLAQWREAMKARQQELHEASVEAWQSVGDTGDLHLLEIALRARGVPFSDGMHEIEKFLINDNTS